MELFARLRRSVATAHRAHGAWGVVTLGVRHATNQVEALSPDTLRGRLRDLQFDLRHGVDTRGVVSLSAFDTGFDSQHLGVRYQTTGDVEFRRMLGELDIDPADYDFIDLGAGKGKMVLLASELPFRRVIGVEFVRELHDIAVRNIAKYQLSRCRDVQSVHGDAGEFSFARRPQVVFMYNPFGGQVLDRVLDNLERWAQCGQPLHLIYHNPEFAERVERRPFLRLARTTADTRFYRTADSA